MTKGTYLVEEVSEYLRVHPYTVRRLAREGKIPAFKVGGQWRFMKELIDKWIIETSIQRAKGSKES